MIALTIQDVSRRCGLSEPTLRYYEQVGLIGPVERDESSGHRRYREDDIDAALDAALRTGVKLDGGLAATVSTREQSHPARADTWDPSSGTAARRVAEIVYQLLGAGR